MKGAVRRCSIVVLLAIGLVLWLSSARPCISTPSQEEQEAAAAADYFQGLCPIDRDSQPWSPAARWSGVYRRRSTSGSPGRPSI
mgnify:CR=1 FL=1